MHWLTNYSLTIATIITCSLLGAKHVLATEYVGSDLCAGCHKNEYELWQNSHHDLAMQEASELTVLGDFADTKYQYFNTTSYFYRKGKDFFVKTIGDSGTLEEFRVRYTFGVEPLQQYLVDFPGGRLQALTLAWDSRPKQDGGQRWFHLQPDEFISHTDELHWTGAYFNWNSRCAECHSTNLKKNFSLENNTFATSWSEIDVACEACHGPGQEHVNWAKNNAVHRGGNTHIAPLRSEGVWRAIEDISTSQNTHSYGNTNLKQMDTCASCHSRRMKIDEDSFARPFAETHALQSLDEGIYHADGQILEENYVYGSFLQSKMYQHGVECSNCHEPHSLKLRFPENQVCAQCHKPETFDTSKHHKHPHNSTGAMCANCHMPATTYMVVDDRRDHSIRIPRPDLTLELGVPNACTQCHKDKDPQWANTAVLNWYPNSTLRKPHFGHAISAGQSRKADALEQLIVLAESKAEPEIARVAAFKLLQDFPSQEALNSAIKNLNAPSIDIRIAALAVLQTLPVKARYPFARPLLTNKSIRVRSEAGRILAGMPVSGLTPEQQSEIDHAQRDYIALLMANSDIAENHVNLSNFYLELGEFDKAEESLKTALKIDDRLVLGMLNLADLYRMSERDYLSEALLKKALRASPENATVHYSLGLLYVRLEDLDSAEHHLNRAAQAVPDNLQYQYAYSLTLDALGKPKRALGIIDAVLDKDPTNQTFLQLKAMVLSKQ